MRTTLWTAFWVFIVDQFTKYVVVHAMGLVDEIVIDVWPPFLTFRMAWNRGVNFGLFSSADMRWVLVALAVVISGLVLLWVRREGGNRIALLSAGFLIGGAMGNVVDRLLYGAVADFINMSCCGIVNPYAFNVADIGVFAGALGLVFFSGGQGSGGTGGKRGGKVAGKVSSGSSAKKPAKERKDGGGKTS